MVKRNEPTAKSLKAPWLNPNGTKKSEDEIRELGKHWSSETWDAYLNSELGTLKDNELTFFENMDTQEVYERSEILKFIQDSKHYENLESAILIALEKLSPKERLIIREAYWTKLTDQEIAEKINSTHATVRNLKHRAIKKIGQFLATNELKAEVLNLKNGSNPTNKAKLRKQWVNSDLLTFC